MTFIPAMLATEYGQLIRTQRIARQIRQEDLAREAGVSRTTLSRLEQGKAVHVQTDVLDRLLAALSVNPTIDLLRQARALARLEQQVKVSVQRERHLRLLLDLAGNPAAAAEKVARAREVVDLWRRNRTCSDFYVDRWQGLLDLPLAEMVRAMQSLGEWEDALLQNSPWSWAWTSTH